MAEDSSLSRAPSGAAESRFGRIEVLGAALLFSTGGAAIKAVSFGGWQVASFRSLIAAAFLATMVAAAGRSAGSALAPFRRLLDRRVLPVALSYAGTVILFCLANKLTTSANAIFLQSTAPLYLLLLGPWLLRERTRPADLALMAPVAAGLALFFFAAEPPQRTAPQPLTGNLLALGSGACWALTLTGLRWLERQHDFPGAGKGTVLAGNLVAGLACLPMALSAGGGAGAPVDWLLLALLGVFQIGVAYLLLTRGLSQVPALEAGLLVLAEPAINPVWAWLVHGERPTALALAGGALILGTAVVRCILASGGREAGPASEPGPA